MIPEFPYFYYCLAFALGILAFALLVIPKNKLPNLFWFGMLWGSGSDFIVEHIYDYVGLTTYRHMEPFLVGTLPLFMVMAWTPTVMVFIHFLPRRKEKYIYWIYITLWSALVYFVAVILKHLDILEFSKGGPWIWMIGSLVFMTAMSKHYRFLEAKQEKDM